MSQSKPVDPWANAPQPPGSAEAAARVEQKLAQPKPLKERKPRAKRR